MKLAIIACAFMCAASVFGQSLQSVVLESGSHSASDGFTMAPDISLYTFNKGTPKESTAWWIEFSIPKEFKKTTFNRSQLILEDSKGKVYLSVPIASRPGTPGKVIIDFFAQKKYVERYKLLVQYSVPPMNNIVQEYVIPLKSYFPDK